MTFELDGYIDVRTRIQRLYELHPDARILTTPPMVMPGRADMIYIVATVFRSPDDPMGTTGMAAELAEGKTTFTKNSELMNCETSAIGRAIANMGIGIEKAVASKEEVKRAKAQPAPTPVQEQTIQAVQEAVDAWGLPIPEGMDLQDETPQCAHGKREWRTGTSKGGKSWSAWMCATKECDPIWG